MAETPLPCGAKRRGRQCYWSGDRTGGASYGVSCTRRRGEVVSQDRVKAHRRFVHVGRRGNPALAVVGACDDDRSSQDGVPHGTATDRSWWGL